MQRLASNRISICSLSAFSIPFDTPEGPFDRLEEAADGTFVTGSCDTAAAAALVLAVAVAVVLAPGADKSNPRFARAASAANCAAAAIERASPVARRASPASAS